MGYRQLDLKTDSTIIRSFYYLSGSNQYPKIFNSANQIPPIELTKGKPGYHRDYYQIQPV